MMMPQGYPIIAFRLSFGMSELFFKREIKPESSLRAVGDADCTSMEEHCMLDYRQAQSSSSLAP